MESTILITINGVMLFRNEKIITLRLNRIKFGIKRLRRISSILKIWFDVFMYLYYIFYLRNSLSGARISEHGILSVTGNDQMYGRNIDSHRNRGEFEHGRDFVQNWSPGEV